MKKYISHLIFTLLVATCGCSNFEYHPYCLNIDGNKDLNTQNINRLEHSGLSMPLKFAFITDTQGALDETKDAIKSIVERGDIDFILHGGNITDFGIVKEYIWYRDAIEKANIPHLTVIGNHDCLGNGDNIFEHIFGPKNFSLNVGPVHIVGLNTVALEYDYSNPIPDMDFIEKDLDRVSGFNEKNPGSITHTIFVMHSRPYDEQFNNNVAKYFNSLISLYPGMDAKGDDGNALRGFCVNGHNHHLNVTDIFHNGILYYQAPDIAKRTYFVFTITESGYEYESIEF